MFQRLQSISCASGCVFKTNILKNSDFGVWIYTSNVQKIENNTFVSVPLILRTDTLPLISDLEWHLQLYMCIWK